MRVLIVTRDFGLGSGLTNVVLDYLRNFPKSLIEVEHASFVRPEPSYREELVSRGIKTFELDERRPLASLRILRSLIMGRSFDLIVGTSWKPYIAAAIARIGTSAGSAAWIHGIPLAVGGPMRKYIYQILFRRQSIIFASKAVQYAHSYRSHAGKQSVVYAGIPPLPTLYSRKMRACIGVPEEAFLVGYTAQFMEWKNHQALLKAVSMLAAQHPSLHVLLIGEGPTYNRVAGMTTALGLDGRVHLLGKRGDARELLGILDAYVHPSDGEAFGLALAEAMLAGLPVIASNTGALPEIVEDGVTGLLVPPHDLHKICEGLVRLINSPDLRAQLGRSAQQAIAKTFTTERFTTDLTAAFENAIAH